LFRGGRVLLTTSADGSHVPGKRNIQDNNPNNGSRFAKLALSSTSISPIITTGLGRTAITVRSPLSRRLRILVFVGRRTLRLPDSNIRSKTNPSTSPENSIEDVNTGKSVNVSEPASARPHGDGD
jgi:hypothetical protein